MFNIIPTQFSNDLNEADLYYGLFLFLIIYCNTIWFSIWNRCCNEHNLTQFANT